MMIFQQSQCGSSHQSSDTGSDHHLWPDDFGCRSDEEMDEDDYESEILIQSGGKSCNWYL